MRFYFRSLRSPDTFGRGALFFKLGRERRLDWAALLSRVFQADVLRCQSCGGPRRVTAFITDGREAREVLDRLGIDSTAPPIAPARAPPRQLGWDEVE